MGFKINSLYLTDGYKVGHKAMLAPGTTKLYGTWIPRSTKHAPSKDIKKIVSAGQQLVWKWLHDEFEENFFTRDFIETEANIIYQLETCCGSSNIDQIIKSLKQESKEEALKFVKDMSLYLGMEYDGKHFEDLWDLGYLPIKVKALPEGIETLPNVPHMTFVNTVDGFGWLTLYLETIVSSAAWKISTSATIALQYRRVATKYIMETDPSNDWFIDWCCHDFSARGLNPWDMILSGLGHAMVFKGSDTIPVIPASRYYYGVKEDEMPIGSVNASEHSVSTTKIFTVGEQQMIADWLKIFPKGILSIVSDTFDLWKLITEYLPANKDAIMAREGKLVIRPDSGDPVDIICGFRECDLETKRSVLKPFEKGVIELLWDIFGGTVNEQGYKVLDPHIGAIYGDSINLQRQTEIYERLKAKGFAATNIVLGIGSFTYQFNTRDTFGFAAKGAWFEVEEDKIALDGHTIIGKEKVGYNIFKDPVTDDGTKKSLKGLCQVYKHEFSHAYEYMVKTECTPEEEEQGLLQVIYKDGKFFNQTTLEKVRQRINSLIK